MKRWPIRLFENFTDVFKFEEGGRLNVHVVPITQLGSDTHPWPRIGRLHDNLAHAAMRLSALVWARCAKLEVVELSIGSVLGVKLGMVAVFDDLTVREHQDAVYFANRR